MKSAFKIENLVFKDLIKYPDLDIYCHETTFITGRSGTGKSTLLRLFNGTLTQSHGTIYFNGVDTLTLEPNQLRQEVLLIGQTVFLFDLNIRDNFKEFYRFRDMEVPSDEVINKYLKLCQIDFPLNKDCTTMSGGERHRVFIAICLSFMPKVLLIDEPTAALDEENSEGLIQNVLQFSKENDITPIIVSHDQKLTHKFAERIISLEGNEINE